ncbi:MAG: GNAT family N-acetyltransferase [Candidatus Binataceae bacterium]|nr:GNAT family N-acetyltransferase [Candidatus Binataceae bacterium]
MSGATSPEPPSPIHKLSVEDITTAFACGQDELNRFLKKFALANQAANAAQTYVTCRANRVIGYYSLAVGSVQPEQSPPRAIKGLAQHPVPVMILARLAVDGSEQGAGIGKALLKDALLRTAQAADIAGIRALVVHAKDENARRWYEQFDFESSPTDPLHLFLLLKDLKKLLK